MTDDTDVPESPKREALPEVGPPGAADPFDAPEPGSLRFDDVPEPMGLKGVLPDTGSDLPEPQHVATNLEVPQGLSESPTIPVPMDQSRPFLEEPAEPADEPDSPEALAETVDQPVAAESVAEEPSVDEEPEPVEPVFGGGDEDLDFPDGGGGADWADDEPPPAKKSMLPVFGGLIALILIGGIGAVFFTNGDKEETPEAEPTAVVAPPDVEKREPVVADVAPEVEEPEVEEPEVEEPEAVAAIDPTPTRSKATSKASKGSKTSSADRVAPADDPWGSAGNDVQPSTVAMRVRTTPPGATIFVDGRSVGKSPTSVDVDPGRHDVRAEMSGYETTSIATMAEGAATDALVTLKKKAAAKAAVRLFGPAGAQVFLGGASIGYVPVQTELTAGTHEFKVVTAEGTFYKVTRSVAAEGGSVALMPE
ncbi:MAG: PEGA domain-containing protein [Proteobacteria bacterium]|nr:PEGA domain-containing protein [Pseudomonadota bacterium]